MFHEEELRRALKQREPRSGREIWPELRRRLETAPARPHPALWMAAIAAIALTAASIRLSRRTAPRPTAASPQVRIARVRASGAPAHAIVLEPDSNTVMVIVDGRSEEEEKEP